LQTALRSIGRIGDYCHAKSHHTHRAMRTKQSSTVGINPAMNIAHRRRSVGLPGGSAVTCGGL
jgi:hypothetical protein